MKQETYMPLALYLSHQLAKRFIRCVRKDGTLNYLRPDGKVQVTVEYDENDNPVRIDTIVVSTQHADDVTLEQIQRRHQSACHLSNCSRNLINEQTKFPSILQDAL